MLYTTFLVIAGATCALALYCLIQLPELFRRVVAASHLNLIGDRAMFVDQKLPLKISPTDGPLPDGKPAAVTDVVWTVSGADGASINTTTPDLLNAELVCSSAAELTIHVTAKNALGEDLVDEAVVSVQERPVVAKFLNLSAGEALPRE